VSGVSIYESLLHVDIILSIYWHTDMHRTCILVWYKKDCIGQHLCLVLEELAPKCTMAANSYTLGWLFVSSKSNAMKQNIKVLVLMYKSDHKNIKDRSSQGRNLDLGTNRKY